MCPNSLGGCRFSSFRFAENSFRWFTNLSHLSHRMSFLPLPQFFFLCGITTP